MRFILAAFAFAFILLAPSTAPAQSAQEFWQQEFKKSDASPRAFSGANAASGTRALFKQASTTTTRVVRHTARQFTPRQIQRNAKAIVTAPVRVIDQGGSWLMRRARDAKRFFMGRGYSPHAAAAIAGHLATESAMQTTTRGDGGYSAGLAQWNGNRLRNLKTFAAASGADWHDFETQLAFIDHELRSSEGLAFGALQRSRNVQEATAAFMHFERPLGYSPNAPQRGHGWWSRLNNAQRIYANYQAEAAASHP